MSKSTRLNQIDGYFHGIHFQVRPTPISVRKLEKEVNQMMTGWYEEHYPDILDKAYTARDIDAADSEKLKEIADYFEKQFAWMEDVEFRSRYVKTMADYAMDFDKEVPEEVWKRDDLQYSTVREAWDFFCGRRPIPSNGR